MLIYQTDAFVFRDELKDWCESGYDYIGAPWFEHFTDKEDVGNFIGVGNGGFSLRKIDTHIKVLNTFSYVLSPEQNIAGRFQKGKNGGSFLRNLGGWILDHTIRNNTHWLLNSFKGHEDQFWGLYVTQRMKWFKVPAFQEALSFAFEMQPRRLMKLNNNELPFITNLPQSSTHNLTQMKNVGN